MERMRVILKRLMDKAGHNPYDVQKRTGVNQSVTFRFVTGQSGEPRTNTVRKWAGLYNLTESQLRGDAPIDGIKPPPEKPDLKNLVSPTEYKLLESVKKLDSEAQGIVQRLAEKLSDVQGKGLEEREPNNHLRVGETRYRTPAKKKRIKDPLNEPKETGTS